MPIASVVGGDGLESLRSEVAALSTGEVVDAARAALEEIANRS